jgi:hypothetical protein
VKALFFVIFSSILSHAQINPGEDSLRAAVLAGGTVTFQNSGVIVLTAPLVIASDVVINGEDKTIAIDGNSTTRLLMVNNATLTLKNLTLVNGRTNGVNANAANQSGGSADGAAILANNALVTIENCVLSNNVARGGDALPATIPASGGAASGGAISMVGGKLTIRKSSFLENLCEAGEGIGMAPGKGGAISGKGTDISIAETIFASNKAIGGKTSNWEDADGFPSVGGSGGAIYASGGSIDLSNCQFMTNSAQSKGVSWSFGGGVRIAGGSLVVSNSTFIENSAVGGKSQTSYSFVEGYGIGGGIALETYHDPELGWILATGQLVNSTFVRNSATALGGLYGLQFGARGGGASIAVTAVVGCTFYANTAGIGGALEGDGRVGVTNCTVVANNSLTGPLGSRGYYIDVKNTLMAFNHPDEGTFPYVDYINDFGNNLCAGVMTNLTNLRSRTNANPLLSKLGEYGGQTPTFLLLAGSPAIDAGDSLAAPAADQRGRPRYGAAADIGAVESAPPFSVFGQVSGRLNSSVSVTALSQTINPAATGAFQIAGIPAGMNTFTFSATNLLIRPASTNIDVNADFELKARGFEYQALAYDPDLPEPSFTFAGHGGETWEFSVSNDLTNWTPISTNSFSVDSTYSLTRGDSQQEFLKGTRR